MEEKYVSQGDPSVKYVSLQIYATIDKRQKAGKKTNENSKTW